MKNGQMSKYEPQQTSTRLTRMKKLYLETHLWASLHFEPCATLPQVSFGSSLSSFSSLASYSSQNCFYELICMHFLDASSPSTLLENGEEEHEGHYIWPLHRSVFCHGPAGHPLPRGEVPSYGRTVHMTETTEVYSLMEDRRAWF